MARFSTLPDDCVQLIFDRVPTESLLTVRRVSRAWQRHQQINCRLRKTLILLYGNSPSDLILNSLFNKQFVPHHIDQNGRPLNYEAFIEHNRIRTSVKKSLQVNFLVKTFPKVHTLIIASDRTISSYLRAIYRLIAIYSPKLVSLQMYFGGRFTNVAHQVSVNNIVAKFIDQLNSLTALKHFTFDAPWRMINGPTEDPQFLNRIKEFMFNCSGLSLLMFEWLFVRKVLQKSNQLTKLYLALHRVHEDLEDNKLDQWPDVDSFVFVPQFADSTQDYNGNAEYLKRIIANYPSLITISVCYQSLRNETSDSTDASLSKLANLLSPLTKLVLLRLELHDVVDIPKLTDPLDLMTMPQLKSIKALEIEYFEGANHDCSMIRNQLDIFVHIFPNLSSIRVTAGDQDHEETDAQIHNAKNLVNDLKFAYGKKSLEVDVLVRARILENETF